MELSEAKSLRPRRSSGAKDEHEIQEHLALDLRNGDGKGLLQGLEEPEALVRRPRRKSEADSSIPSND